MRVENDFSSNKTFSFQEKNEFVSKYCIWFMFKILLWKSAHLLSFRVGKVPSIIFSGSKYLGYIPRYLLEVNTLVQRGIGYYPHARVFTFKIFFQTLLSFHQKFFPLLVQVDNIGIHIAIKKRERGRRERERTPTSHSIPLLHMNEHHPHLFFPPRHVLFDCK